MSKPVCVVIGIGPGNGDALARRFAEENHTLYLLSRSTEYSARLASELPDAHALVCDASDAASISHAFAQIREAGAAIDVVVYNAGPGVFGNIEEVDAAGFEMSWRVNAMGAFLVAQEVIPQMKARGSGNIVFMGATASRRGVARTAAFAPAKAAQRSLAESLARYLGPMGIHVSLVVIDGVIDLPRSRTMMPDRDDEFFMKAEDIAATVYHLTTQPRSAWSFEVDLRPFGERW